MSLTVDVHHHVIPDFYWQASNEDGACRRRHHSAALESGGRDCLPRRGRDRHRGGLDQHARACTSETTGRPATLARRVNEYLADIKRERPDRFGAFAAIPLPDVDGSLEQIDYALDTLRLDGVSLMTNADGSYLGESRFDPVFEELQRRAAVVFVHPTASPDPIAHTLGLPDSLLDYPVDTSRAIAKLHFSNTFARTPDVKYVFPHAGGTIPFVASRFAIVDQMNVIPGADERGPFMDTLRRLTGTRPQPSATQCCTCCDRSPGWTRCCWEPTTPTRTMRFRSAVVEHIRNSAELDDESRPSVLGDAAARLLPALGPADSRSYRAPVRASRRITRIRR